MRLINIRTLRLEEFYGDQIPKYAILSHTWGQGEVTFQDWEDRDAASRKAGFNKIRRACRRARKDSLEYLWVDTNCIDKKSSAELSEAINSMFAWYRDAEICYAFLADVDSNSRDTLRLFRRSRWFTRGWTLQELLAPQEVVFFDQNWTKIGRRSSSLSADIAEITGIDASYITGWPLLHANVAEKMSWLSRRVTTRIEDMAYCMLGIFDINMPLLYGEGMKAFVRLQEEIVKISTDHSIFCWTWIESVPKDWVSMLAPTPAAFEFAKNYVAPRTIKVGGTPSYSFTNTGLSIQLPLVSAWNYSFALLDTIECYRGGQAAIPLRYVYELNTFKRIPFPKGPIFIKTSLPESSQHMFVSARAGLILPEPAIPFPSFRYGLILTTSHSLDWGWEKPESLPPVPAPRSGIITTYPVGLWDENRSLIRLPTQHSRPDQIPAVLVQLSVTRGEGFLMFVATRVRSSGEVLWFCRLRPTSARRIYSEPESQKLRQGFEDEISKGINSIMRSGSLHPSYNLDILPEAHVMSGTLVHIARISRHDD